MSKEVDDILIIATEEVLLLKQHFEKYGTIDIDLIIQSLMQKSQRHAIKAILDRMLRKNYNESDVLEISKQYNLNKELQ